MNDNEFDQLLGWWLQDLPTHTLGGRMATASVGSCAELLHQSKYASTSVDIHQPLKTSYSADHTRGEFRQPEESHGSTSGTDYVQFAARRVTEFRQSLSAIRVLAKWTHNWQWSLTARCILPCAVS